jgi:hypothetical protein
MSKLIIKSGVHVTKIKFCHQNGAGIRRSCLPWVLDGRPAKPTNKQASSREPPDAPHGFEPRTINLPPRDAARTSGRVGTSQFRRRTGPTAGSDACRCSGPSRTERVVCFSARGGTRDGAHASRDRGYLSSPHLRSRALL